jgi:CubicO group peptidase (beta-lactamase class C family)
MNGAKWPALLALLTITAPTFAGEEVPPAQFTDPQRRQKLARAFPELERIAKNWLEERRAPGLAWGVVIDGELAASGSAGFRDVAGRRPVDADTVFRIASMTKSFTALAILMLRDEGHLELDAPASRYVPELTQLARPTRDAEPITVRHLLTHTAGFPEDNPWGDRQLAISDEELSRWLTRGLPFSSATGSAYEYSNYGFAILGRIVTNVSGLKYRDFVNQRIFGPLGMTASYWDPKDVPKARLATGYREQDGEYLPEIPLGDGAFGSMGGMLTSSRDLARWVGWMLAAYPPRDDPERPPASRRSVREMQQGSGFPRVMARAELGTPAQTSADVYAFGLRASRSCELGTQVGHSGGLPGYGSNMVWLPEHGVGLFAMANLTYASPGAMLRDMLRALARTGALEPRRPQPSPALSQTVQRLAQLLDRWSDADARQLAADNLFLDETLERRRTALQAARADLGSCAPRTLEAENALRGRFRMSCERGWLDVDLTLAPTRPPRVQHLKVTRGKPLAAGMQESVSSVLEAMTRGPRDLTLGAELARDSIGTLLAEARERYGSCRIEAPQEGDGETHARVRLECDRGALDLTIARGAGKIRSLHFEPPSVAACTP